MNTVLNNTEHCLENIRKLLIEECFGIPQGKLIRSRIGLELLNLLNIEYSEIYNRLFLMIELIHNASILHDDVLDNETKRRGEISLNRTVGNKKSIIYGDYILIKALKLAEKFESKPLRELFQSAVENMCKGELYQNNNSDKNITIEKYINNNRLKTGKLFRTIGEGIIIISGLDNIDGIADFCENFGIAFQIINDLTDYRNEQTDLTNGIHTAPVIYEEITKDKNKSIEKTLGLADNYMREAFKSLDMFGDDKKGKLIEITNYSGITR